jgi:hypothetical protein
MMSVLVVSIGKYARASKYSLLYYKIRTVLRGTYSTEKYALYWTIRITSITIGSFVANNTICAVLYVLYCMCSAVCARCYTGAVYAHCCAGYHCVCCSELRVQCGGRTAVLVIAMCAVLCVQCCVCYTGYHCVCSAVYAHYCTSYDNVCALL